MIIYDAPGYAPGGVNEMFCGALGDVNAFFCGALGGVNGKLIIHIYILCSNIQLQLNLGPRTSDHDLGPQTADLEAWTLDPWGWPGGLDSEPCAVSHGTSQSKLVDQQDGSCMGHMLRQQSQRLIDQRLMSHTVAIVI